MKVGETTGKDEKGKEVEKEVWQVLLLSDPYNVTGADIRDARPGTDPETASPDVLFSFNAAGGQKFGRLTGEHVPLGDFRYNLAIVLDDVLQTAPTIQSTITDSGRITGNFTPQEVQEIVDIINAGSLPAALEPQPVRDMTTEATLGAETIRQSTFAMMISSIAVPLFMLFYYRFAGLVAVLVLSLNMLMLVALMILFKAPFTLPALAGLALTVGMAVDNNVLIYERLREELAHGAALRMAIRNAFHRVGVVIIDANITHLIAATVLCTRGHGADQGLCRHVLAGGRLEHLGDDVRGPRDVRSFRAPPLGAEAEHDAMDRPHEDRLHGLVPGLRDLLGGHYRAGTGDRRGPRAGLVRHRLHRRRVGADRLPAGTENRGDPRSDRWEGGSGEPPRPNNCRGNPKELPDATVTDTHSQDEPENQRFIIDTSNPDREQVEDLLKQLFGEKLVTLTLSSTVGTPLAPEKPATTTEEKKPATTTEEKKPAATKEEKKPETTKKPETAKEETKPAKTASPPVTNPPEKKPTKPEDKRSEPPAEKSAPEAGRSQIGRCQVEAVAVRPAAAEPRSHDRR